MPDSSAVRLELSQDYPQGNPQRGEKFNLMSREVSGLTWDDETVNALEVFNIREVNH